MTKVNDESPEASQWVPSLSTILPIDMVVPAAEVTVSAEGVMKAIDYLFKVMEDETAKPELRVQAASSIVNHHARRRPL